MKKFLPIMLSMMFLLQSCFTTRYVSNENILRKEFANAMSSDVEFKMGEPKEIEEQNNGYTYTYYYNPTSRRSGAIQEYSRFSFDNNDNLRNIQSTKLVKQKRFSVGKTVFLSVGVPVIIITVAALAAASE